MALRGKPSAAPLTDAQKIARLEKENKELQAKLAAEEKLNNALKVELMSTQLSAAELQKNYLLLLSALAAKLPAELENNVEGLFRTAAIQRPDLFKPNKSGEKTSQSGTNNPSLIKRLHSA
jgi:hypothetical protein